MNYTKKQFIKDVKKEAIALRKNATKKEIEKLDIKTLFFWDITKCVYGQMTGDCRSRRAVYLISKCCKRFIKQGEGNIPKTIDDVKRFVNGKKSESPNSLTYLSSIETYIAMPFAKNENLLQYLRKERNDLVL